MSEITAVREVLQAKLLVEMMGNAVHKELVLKGGLAMRAVHGSRRHTKDIDFDADVAFTKDRIHGLVARSIARVVSASPLITHATVTEPKQTETTLRWKINGLVAGTTTPMHLTVEVSRRNTLARDHVIEAQLDESFSPAVKGATVRVLDSRALAVTKIMALTDVNRMAPRDIYDLHVLIRADVEPPIALLASQPKERLEAALAELWIKLDALPYPQFQQEVMPYLPQEVAKGIDENAYADMQLEVGERVERWIIQALEQQSVTPPGLGGGALGSAPEPAAAPSAAAKTTLAAPRRSMP